MSGNNPHRNEGHGRGLQTELHPALKSSNLTLIKEQQHKANPYLSNEGTVKSRKPRLSRFYQRGEIIKRVSKERSKLQEIEKQVEIELVRKQEEQKHYESGVAKGELPDLRKDEDKIFNDISNIPVDVEWWDSVYLDKKTHKILEKYIVSDYDSEEEEDNNSVDDENTEYAPSIHYVHHPIPVKGTTDDDNRYPRRIYLTKKEHRRIRRNNRKLAREEIEAKIKLGLEPKPEPKVKLSNMMHVLENDANIVDPTNYEQNVIKQVQQRKKNHLEENRIRHEEAVFRRKEKLENLDAKAIHMANSCNVYRFQSLQNPKIRYKLNMNAKQLKLRGCCLRVHDSGPGMIIVVGEEKSIKFFDKLVTRRLKWDENFEDRRSNQMVDMSNNNIEKVWNGYINLEEHNFSNWFMRVCNDESELKQILSKFNGEVFYRHSMI